jgi:hypothetical protein
LNSLPARPRIGAQSLWNRYAVSDRPDWKMPIQLAPEVALTPKLIFDTI